MNHRKNHFLKLFIILTFTCAYGHTKAYNPNHLPNLPGQSHAFLSPQKARQIGQAIMRQLRSTPLLNHDPILNLYLAHLGNRLVAHTSTTQFPYHFFGIDRFDANAFAFHGGYIGVHKGLILLTENENELAAVMAHEIAHTQQRHLARIALENHQMMPITLLELLGAVAIGVAAPEAGVHLLAGVLGSHVQQLINFTRAHEQEADNIGIHILAKSGFDPFAMATIFEHMGKATEFQNKPAEYLSTHPLFTRRIAMAQNRAEKYPYKQTENTLEYELIKGYLFAQSQDAKGVLKQLQTQLNSKRYTNEAVVLFSLGMALIENRQYRQSIPYFEKALKHYPENIIIQLGLIEAQKRANLLVAALKRAEALHVNHPDHLAVGFTFAELLMQQNNLHQIQKAKTLLMQLQKNHIEFLPLYRSLAKSERLLKQLDNMHLHLAHWHFLQAEFEKAQAQLTFAKKYVGNNTEKKAYIQEKSAYFKEIAEKEKKLLSFY